MKASRSLTATLFLCLSALTGFPVTFTDTFVPGLNLIANHVNTGNTMSVVFGNSLPDGTVVYYWDKVSGGFIADIYLDGFGWLVDGILNPGEGAFLQNPTAVPISHTYNGA